MTDVTTAARHATTDNRTVLDVGLVYDRDCPNIGDCRDALRSALTEFGVWPSWSEWDRNSADTPTEYRRFGSPTVLVNGRDIHAPRQDVEPDGNSCRVYPNDVDGGFAGYPSVTSIVNTLMAAARGGPVVQHGTANITTNLVTDFTSRGTQQDTRTGCAEDGCTC